MCVCVGGGQQTSILPHTQMRQFGVSRKHGCFRSMYGDIFYGYHFDVGVQLAVFSERHGTYWQGSKALTCRQLVAEQAGGKSHTCVLPVKGANCDSSI